MTRSAGCLETAGRHPRAQSDCSDAHKERGFVLVGVVMFVLALTILGLSLFSLSGYEAQFMTASYRRTQLFYDAMSALDRTKYVLATSGRLETASSYLPLPGLPSIVMAEAIQDSQSTGDVVWSDTSMYVRIRVRAEQPGRPSESTSLEALYKPQTDQSLYRDLIATTGHIAVYHDSDDYEFDNIWGCGNIRNLDASDWLGQIKGAVNHVGSHVPVPNVLKFIDEWQPSSVGPPDTGGATHSYRFDVQSKPYRVFSGPSDPKFGFDLWDAASDTITFEVEGTGTAVWLLPAGAYFEQRVTVTGSPSSNLIIVARTSTNPKFRDSTGVDLGLWFEGGISSPSTGGGPNLFLVSDGTVALDRWRGTSHDNSIRYLTVFSGGVYLRGPKGGPGYVRKFEISHCGADDDAILGPLYADGLLPNTRERTRSFALVPGSFREIADSSPN